jgi:hypothetical protein
MAMDEGSRGAPETDAVCALATPLEAASRRVARTARGVCI